MIQQTPELQELEREARGLKPFNRRESYEALAELDAVAQRKLDAQTRLQLGYYLRARELAEARGA